MTTKQIEFLQMLDRTLGVVTTALDRTGVTREEYKEWMEGVFFKVRVEEIQEKSLDYVENKLMNLINEGNLSAIQFYLKTKGKDRGYV